MALRDPGLEASERLYGLLLLLYPPDLRVRFGPEMVQVFRDSYRYGAQNGGRGVGFAFWLQIFQDLALSLPVEWGRALAGASEIEVPLRVLADWLVIPLVISGSLLVAAYIGGTLAKIMVAIPASRVPRNEALVLATAVVVAVSLGFLGMLGAFLVAHNRRTRGSSIRLRLWESTIIMASTAPAKNLLSEVPHVVAGETVGEAHR